MNALPNIKDDVFQLTPELLETGLAASRESPRRRMILPIHRRQDDLVQRMLNFLQPGTYIQPHLHQRESATETIFVIRGRLGFILFDNRGSETSATMLEPGDLIDIEPDIWHGMVCLEQDTVILEIKRGPYDEIEDKTFADWAPGENDGEITAKYYAYLEAMFP
ncbi:MAG: WbuC family cupin fold metalloprotein [Verrucomicrobiales bacterium]|nr:WbuC family cupin fold metalloprotein [Verrucomicrobiales bacterium]